MARSFPPLLLAALLLPAALPAQVRLEPDTAPRIVVSVTRTTRIVPDRASLYATVEGSAETPADAMRRVQQKLDAVLGAVRALGARVDPPVAVPYGIVPAPTSGGFGQPASGLPYIARYAVKLLPRQLDQLQEVAAAAIAAGATSTSNLVFESSAADSVRRALTADAVRQAQRDADLMAESLGGRRGALVDVTLGATQFSGFQTNTIAFTSRFDGGAPAGLPEVPVTSSVTVRYRLAR